MQYIQAGMSGQAESGGAGPPGAFRAADGKGGSRRSTRFKDENEYVEVTLDVVGGGGDAVSVRCVKSVGAGDLQEAALLPRPAAPGPGGLSSKLKAARAELRRIASSGTKRGVAGAPPQVHGDRRRLDRSMTGAARALRGLQFLNQSAVTEGWPEVEKRFEKLAVDGFLLRSRFGQCIGELPSAVLQLTVLLF